MTRSDDIYEAYKMVKNFIKRSEECCEKDHGDEPLFKEWKDAIEIFDSLKRGYAERYEKEKAMDDLIKAIEDMCLLTDEFAKKEITPGTPLYDYQQSMIANVKRYREQKDDSSRR